MLRAVQEKHTYRSIAREFGCAVSTVAYTVKQAKLRNEGESLRRLGRPKSYTERDRRRITRLLKLHPF